MSELELDLTKTDSDTEEYDDDTFDNYDVYMDLTSFPPRCEKEHHDMDSISDCFDKCYDACLMFFMGSLRNACQVAFSSTAIEQRRPILVYIHNDENLFRKKFCETMLYSTTIIDYLNMNYVVWPWDVTSETDRYTLAKIWEEMFSTQFFDEFSIEQCPLLIGIGRLFEYKTDGILTSEYQFESLVKGNTLTSTQMTVDRDILLNELDIFKKKCDRNEQDLSFDFVKKTGLCWEIILEIGQYLSLNDTISAFSIHILPLLKKSQSKFQLSNPCDPFIKWILPKIQSEQIISLQFNTNSLYSKAELDFLSNFNEVVSITLHNTPSTNQISEYIECLPKLTRLSLCYDDKVDDNILSGVLNQLQSQIKRFEIHCPGIFYTGGRSGRSNEGRGIGTRIDHFLLDIRYHPWTSTCARLQHPNPCFFLTRSDFMKMPNIRHIQFIINKCDIEHYLDDDQWKMLMNVCPQLQKIMVQVLGNITEDEQYLVKKVLKIQTKLRTIRQTIKFQISFL